MKNFITNLAEGLIDVSKWILFTVLMGSLIMVAFAILFVLWVLDMTILTIFRAIIHKESLIDEVYEELELWGELLKKYFAPYFEETEL